MANAPLIDIDHLHCSYDGMRQALTDVSLRVYPGQVVLLTGPSGCGKSTLLSVVNGVIPCVTGGQVRGRVTVAGLVPSQAGITRIGEVAGTLMQDPESQFFSLTVADELTFGPRARGEPYDRALESARRAAETMGLADDWDRDIHRLSEGRRQLAGIASLLALGPRVLLLDEPTANLDAKGRSALARTLCELKRAGCAVLVADHRLRWLTGVADTVLVMREGRVVDEGTLEAVAGRGELRSLAQPVRSHEPAAEGDAKELFGVSGFSWAMPKDGPVRFDNLAMSLPAGLTALVGPNGSGKTALARVLAGLEKGTCGVVRIRGKALEKSDERLEHCALVLQNADHQLQMRTVWEEASAAWRLANRPKGRFVRMPPLREEGEEAVRRTLTRLGLLEFSSRHPQSLSGGQKQRLVIACAILKDPALLILDEPTSGLDGENLKKLAELLQSQARAGRAVLVVTHDEDLLAYCNSVIDVRDLMHGKAAAPTSD